MARKKATKKKAATPPPAEAVPQPDPAVMAGMAMPGMMSGQATPGQVPPGQMPGANPMMAMMQMMQGGGAGMMADLSAVPFAMGRRVPGEDRHHPSGQKRHDSLLPASCPSRSRFRNGSALCPRSSAGRLRRACSGVR